MRRILAAFAALAVMLALGACGSRSPRAHTQTVHKPHCKPADLTLKCGLPPATAPVPPPPEPASVVTSTTAAVAVSFHKPRLTYGIDFGWGGPSAATMRANGWRFGASYLSFDPGKNWHVGQISEYRRAGIARVYVWETTADRVLGGCLAGESDALAASGQIGREARVIYFAVDFDEQASQAATVAGYFRCAGRILGVAHTGAYGGFWTVKRLFDAHLIRYGWQTYAWSNGLWDARAQLEQYLNGSSYDHDRAITADYGQTPYRSAPTRLQLQEQLWHLYRERTGVKTKIATLSALLTKHGCRPPHHATPKSYHRHACPTWKQEGDASHKHLTQIERAIRQLHSKGVR